MSDNSFVTVDVPDGISIGELLDELEMDADEVKRMLVNGLNSDFERVLTDGDQVALYPGG